MDPSFMALRFVLMERHRSRLMELNAMANQKSGAYGLEDSRAEYQIVAASVETLAQIAAKPLRRIVVANFIVGWDIESYCDLGGGHTTYIRNVPNEQ